MVFSVTRSHKADLSTSPPPAEPVLPFRWIRILANRQKNLFHGWDVVLFTIPRFAKRQLSTRSSIYSKSRRLNLPPTDATLAVIPLREKRGLWNACPCTHRTHICNPGQKKVQLLRMCRLKKSNWTPCQAISEHNSYRVLAIPRNFNSSSHPHVRHLRQPFTLHTKRLTALAQHAAEGIM